MATITVPKQLHLTPYPRVFQMLGEINLIRWRRLAELIDNSIDEFLNADRAGIPIGNLEVSVTKPTRDDDTARIPVKDNEPECLPIS
jgi:hypothetical protein